MANRFRQFRLLLWKNFILQIRRPIGTTFELLVPLAIVCVLIIPKLLNGDRDQNVSLKQTEQHCFSTFEPMFLSQNLKLDVFKYQYPPRKNNYNNTFLAFYPPGDPVASLMSKVSRTIAVRVTNKSVIHAGKSFTSIDDVIAEVREHDDVYVGVVVFDIKEGQSELPKKLKYAIRLTTERWERWRTDKTYPGWQSPGPSQYSQYTSNSRFIYIQYAVDMAIIQEKTNISSVLPLNLQRFPYPDYITRRNVYSGGIIELMPLLFTLAFIYSAMSIIKEIVFEKQNRLKESMKMMGLANWVHWAAWYIKCLLFLMISLVFTTAILKGFEIFEHTNGFLLFLFLLLYAMSGISYCFFISVFFSSPPLGMLFGSVLWIAALVPGLILSTFNNEYDQLDWSAKAAMCLLPNSALSIGVRLITRFEGLNVGITFKSINEPYTPEDTFTMAWVFGMMLISSVVYMVLTWYIEGIFPGKYGISKPFYFPFLKSYWCGYSDDDLIRNNDKMKGDEELHHSHDVEDEPADLEVGVAIKNLRKVFKGSTGAKVAVDGLSLKIFKGQITALLGHNGAGKTTTISILTGLFPPTSGSAVIGNKSILTDIDAIRESLGLCPQHNVLFDRLTVKEHLEFFVNLKGKYGQAAKDEVMSMITDMQLLDKTNEKSRTLSGGMKRKLSCAIALVGGSETVFLDEPTSGMDPYARRATWDLLLKYKAGKTIILTTHFMDEADFLGDRIAIMADGQLRCCGSSLFLKSRYGVGYHLTLVKKEGFNENVAINAIKRVVPSAEILSNVGSELELVLTREAAKSFESLFLELENKKEEYGIASFGVSVTTMEEVFMKVGEGSEKTVEDVAIDHQQHRDTDNIIEMSNNGEPKMGELLKGLPLKWQQYKAMLMKRFLNSKRDKKAVVTQLIVPLVMILFGLLIADINFSSRNKIEPPRVLSLSNLSTDDSNVVAFHADFSQPQKDFKVAKDFLKTIRVDAKDILDDVKAIHLGNANKSIEVKGTKYTYTTPTKNKTTACCEYQFLILNKKCKSDFMNKSLTSKVCSKNKNFGYTKCNDSGLSWRYTSDCLLSEYNSRCANSLRKTNLDDMNVYFSEYVLEKSDNKNYFKKHVAGFTFGPAPTIKNVTASYNGTNKTKSVVVMPDTKSTVWYSNKGYHTIADALNAMSNILLRRHSRLDDFIETTNYPIPAKKKAREEGAEYYQLYYLAIFLAMGMAFMAASFIIFLVQERSSKAKHLQFVSGVDAVCYWLATYTWDYINYLISTIFVLILIASFQLDAFKDDLGTVLLLLLLFGLCALPFIYCLSFLFTSPLIAYALTVFILSILSLAMLITVFVFRLMGDFSEKYKEDAEIMHNVFMLFPTYTLSISFHDMSLNYKRRTSCTISPEAIRNCKSRNTTYTKNPLDWDMPGVGQEVLFMFLEAIVLFILTILIQVNFLVGIASKENSENASNSGVNRDEDEDVRVERQRVLGLDKENIEKESVVIKNLTKVYRGSNRTAVDHLCIGIPRGECFGLLGVNGAGKTTTFSMLTGDQSITEGSAYLDGYNLQTQLRQVQQRIGYCPQFDALIERMTGREMLKMYAQLRGVHPSKIDEIVSSTISKLNLGKWADKLSGNYSGGNKRKLSTAIALVGDPPIVFLDEPTSGMDPVARRFLWNALIHVMKGGRSIVLTSHSMEECEALCTRLAIMVNGQFKCIGSTQHLKSRFGTGYTLMIKVKGRNQTANSVATVSQVTPAVSDVVYVNPTASSLTDVHDPGYPMHNAAVPQQLNTPPVAFLPPPSDGAYPQQLVLPMDTDAAAVSKAKSFIEETFQGAVLMESHSGMLTYHIINEDLTWSQIFGNLERNREMLGIVDYSVSQTTLDQVFINFAKEQHSEERTKVKRKCGCLPCC